MAESTLIEELKQDLKNIKESEKSLYDLGVFCRIFATTKESTQTAVECTKDYVNQSLASVAYQINLFGFKFGQLLDQQVVQLDQLKSQLTQVDQVLNIHHEKQSRKKVGCFACDKRSIG